MQQLFTEFTDMSAVGGRKFVRSINTRRFKHANVQGGHTKLAMVLSDLPA